MNLFQEESKDLESKDSTSVNSDSGFEVSDENQSGTESPKSSAIRTEEMRPLVRLCISVAFHSPLAQRAEVALLGVRPLADKSNVVDAVNSTVEQVIQLNNYFGSVFHFNVLFQILLNEFDNSL